MNVAKGMTVDEQGRLNNFAIEPEMYVDETPNVGFNYKAEMLNGRLAMIGFVAALAVEAVTGKGLIESFTSFF